MTYKISINGYGRIGRCILRALYESTHKEYFKIVAINELAGIETIAHLTKHDTTHGRFSGHVSLLPEKQLMINNDIIHVFNNNKITDLPWSDLAVDVVMECTGSFTSRNMAEQHLQSGAKKVIFSQPAESDVDATIVYGVNEHTLTADHRIISNASCTSNCLIPIIKIIDDAMEIECGSITTIHSMMNDQPVIDAYHHNDLRRTRAAGQSIIPVNTELAYGIYRILPHLSGRFEAIALRVPTINVSAMDINVLVRKNTDAKTVNTILADCARGPMARILEYTEEPLASCDFNHDSHSAIIDGSQTRVIDHRMIKIFAWFDNEWGYANRMLDTALALLRVQQ